MKPTSIRGAVITHVGDDNNLNTPAGLSRGFLNIARECLEDARILHNLSPSFEPALDVTDIPDEALLRLDTRGKYILTAHALELGLKAFLAKHGFSKKKIINGYSHNLDRLYSEAVQRGLDLSSIPEVQHKIAWLNEYHDKGALLRYSDETKSLLPCNTLFPIIDALLLASEPSSAKSPATRNTL
jgi:hypothetical protein